MTFRGLRRHLGLKALRVKNRAEVVGVGRLEPVIAPYADVAMIAIAEVVIDTNGVLVFLFRVWRSDAKFQSTRRIPRQRHLATSTAAAVRYWCRARRARSTVEDLKHLLIERNLC